MSYNKPHTIIVDGKMIVPVEQQKEIEDGKKKIRLFSYKHTSKVVLDINTDLKNNTIPALKDLAMVLGISASKLKKQELVDVLKQHIVFE